MNPGIPIGMPRVNRPTGLVSSVRVPKGIYRPSPIDVSKYGRPGLGAPSGGGPEDLLNQVSRQLGIMASTAVLRRGMINRIVSVSTTPALVIRATSLKGYLIINPSSALASGTTATGTLVASASRAASGNSQASSLGVANFRSAHLYLDVSSLDSGTPTLDVYAQSLDPVSNNWADAQLAFDNAQIGAPAAVGTYYAYLGPNGLGSDLAARWVIAGGGLTFSIGYVLKEGLPGSSTGLARTIYLGSTNGVASGAGFPLLEGQSWAFYMEENSELWAVGDTSLTLNVFELQ